MGSTISRATLHNEDYVKNKDLKIGDIVSIRKAGDVIPEVVEVKKERRTGNELPFQMITECPICHTKLEKKQDQVDYYCPNTLCPARHVESFIHFVSRPAMNIDGLGDRIMEDLYNFHFIHSIADIYALYTKKEELIKLEGYGQKSVDKLLESIEKSKENSLERLIFGLGIPHVGAEKAKILAAYFQTMDNLQLATKEQLVKLPDIGEVIADSLLDYFQNNVNQKLIIDLKDAGLNMNYLGQEKIKNANFTSKKFVITGTLSSMTREQAKQEIEKRGGKSIENVSKKIEAIIVGKDPGSKYEKAKQLNLPIWTEEEFLEKIKDN